MVSRITFACVVAMLSSCLQAAEVVVFRPGAVAKRVADGERGDVVISTTEVLAGLAQSGKVAAPSIRPLGSMGVGVTIRAGSPLPDVRTVASFKAAMLAARSIAFADPAFGGQSGIHVAQVFEQLGIARELNPKLQLRPGAPEAFKEVARGEIEIGLGQISEILADRELVLIGPLPLEIQSSVAFAAGVHSGAAAGDAAPAFIAFLTTPAAKERFRKLGFDVK